MRKRLLVSFVAAFMLLGVGAALADPGAETGAGKDATCEDGTSCPTPSDPTGGDENMVPAGPVAVGGHQDGVGGGLYVSVGDEGQANSLGRASISGSQSDGSVGVYAEDYTEGNQFANGIESANEGAGCPLPIGDGTCDTSADSPDDAAYVHN